MKQPQPDRQESRGEERQRIHNMGGRRPGAGRRRTGVRVELPAEDIARLESLSDAAGQPIEVYTAKLLQQAIQGVTAGWDEALAEWEERRK